MRILYVCHDLDYWRAWAERMRGRGAWTAALCGVPPGKYAGLGREERRGLFPIERQALDPSRDVALAARVVAEARRCRADAVHLIGLKPILFGGTALRVAMQGRMRTVATFPGLGRVFAPRTPDARQRLVLRGLRAALGGRRTVAAFENPADRDRLVAAGVVPTSRTAVMRGAGIDPAAFLARPMPPGPAPGAPLRCLYAGRLLRSKGVGAVVEAARILASQGVNARIALAGAAGGDPDAVPEAEVAALATSGLIDVLGSVRPSSMPAIFAGCHVLLMPTRYPEGSPRVLPEAGCVGRPAIVSDHPGCAAFVRDGIEGIVLPSPDGASLAAAIRTLAEAPGRVAVLGAAARARVFEGGFTIDAVADSYARLYAGDARD